jgi:DNA-binding NarL/FixJ family response regulator
MDLTTSGERPTIRVLVADDHTIVRGGVSQILNEQPDSGVVRIF